MSPQGAGRRTDRVARSRLTTGQGARHWGSSLAPATDKSSMAGASCASSLPASPVVTMRLAQRCCRSYAARIAAATVGLVPLRSAGLRRSRAYHTQPRLAQNIYDCNRWCRWGGGVGLSPANAAVPPQTTAAEWRFLLGRLLRAYVYLRALRLPVFRR